MIYKVLKDWNNITAGTVVSEEAFDPSITPEVVAGLINDGTIEPMVDDVDMETVTVDQAYLDANPELAAKGLKIGNILEVEKLGEEEEADYVVTQEFLDKNPGYVADVGETIKLPKSIVDAEAASETADAANETQAPVTPITERILTYRGQAIISQSVRDVNGLERHTVRLQDGSSQDITDAEFEALELNGSI